jgi:hypothetical protein
MALFRSRNKKLPSTQSRAFFNSITRSWNLNPKSAFLLAVLLSTPVFAVPLLGADHSDSESNREIISAPTTGQRGEAETNIEASQESALASVSSETSSSTSGSVHNSNDTQVEINVNGEQISVPPNSSVHRVIEHENGNGQTVVDVQTNQSGNSSSFTHSVSTSSVTTSSSNGGASVTVQHNSSN